jgi:hypothetical protein
VRGDPDGWGCDVSEVEGWGGTDSGKARDGPWAALAAGPERFPAAFSAFLNYFSFSFSII